MTLKQFWNLDPSVHWRLYRWQKAHEKQIETVFPSGKPPFYIGIQEALGALVLLYPILPTGEMIRER